MDPTPPAWEALPTALRREAPPGCRSDADCERGVCRAGACFDDPGSPLPPVDPGAGGAGGSDADASSDGDASHDAPADGAGDATSDADDASDADAR